MIDPVFLRKMAGVMALAMELAATVVLSTLAGSWLDTRLGSSPIFLLLLSLLALVVGMMRLTQGLKRLNPEDESDPPDDRN